MTADTKEAVQVFDEHALQCRQCANEPFNLCATGTALLRTVMKEAAKPDTALFRQLFEIKS